MVYLYILITLAGTTVGQLLLKYGMTHVGEMPPDLGSGMAFLIRALLNPLVLLSLFLAFIAALGWIAAVSKTDLSFAYPFMSLGPALVLLFSSILLKEHVSLLRWIGVIVIGIGVLIVSRS